MLVPLLKCFRIKVFSPKTISGKWDVSRFCSHLQGTHIHHQNKILGFLIQQINSQLNKNALLNSRQFKLEELGLSVMRGWLTLGVWKSWVWSASESRSPSHWCECRADHRRRRAQHRRLSSRSRRLPIPSSPSPSNWVLNMGPSDQALLTSPTPSLRRDLWVGPIFRN